MVADRNMTNPVEAFWPYPENEAADLPHRSCITEIPVNWVEVGRRVRGEHHPIATKIYSNHIYISADIKLLWLHTTIQGYTNDGVAKQDSNTKNRKIYKFDKLEFSMRSCKLRATEATKATKNPRSRSCSVPRLHLCNKRPFQRIMYSAFLAMAPKTFSWGDF